MNPTVIGAVVGATATIFGVFVTLWANTLSQRLNVKLQAKIERDKRDEERHRQMQVDLYFNAKQVHKIACLLGREFSITGMNIDFTASITPLQWDEKYKLLCDQSDELIMIADLYLPSIRQSAKSLYDQMNVYWGNLKFVLQKEQAGKSLNHDDVAFADVHKCAILISSICSDIKKSIIEAINAQKLE